MTGFRSIKKPVILEIPIKTIVTPTGTDIPFLTKMQKRANPTELKPPFFNNKSSINNYYGKECCHTVCSNLFNKNGIYEL